MPPSCLLIIDVQNGFINQHTAHIPALVEELQAGFDMVIATRFENPDGSPYRRLIHWSKMAPGESDTELAFAPDTKARVVRKRSYTCLSENTLKLFEDNNISEVHLCGIATDNCVLKTAADLFEAGLTPIVLADYCASHGGPECHAAGLLVLRRMIGADQVVEGTGTDSQSGA